MPTSTYSKFNQFVEDRSQGVYNFTPGTGHQLKVALCSAANAPVATNSVLADLTTVSLANLVSDTLTINASSGQTSGTYKLIIDDKILEASGGNVGPFRYVVVYNDTSTSPADPLIAWFDYGSEVTLGDGEYLNLDFDGSNGFLSDT